MLPPKLSRVFLFLMSSFFLFFVAFSLSSFVFMDITVIDILLPCLFCIIFLCLCHSYKFFTANIINSDLLFNRDGSFSLFSLNRFTLSITNNLGNAELLVSNAYVLRDLRKTLLDR